MSQPRDHWEYRTAAAARFWDACIYDLRRERERMEVEQRKRAAAAQPVEKEARRG